MANRPLIHSTSGIELIRKIAEEGMVIFNADQAKDLAPTVGISKEYLRQALHHLTKAGWIIRLRKGLYSLSSSMPGIAPLHEFEIAMALIQPAAISHWSALNYHGLTEQTPRIVFILTPARAPNHAGKALRIHETTYQFIHTKSNRFFGIETVWINDSKVNITDKERTLLDCLMAPQYCGGFSEVLYAFEKNSKQLDIQKIIEYALKLDTSTIKRLGWILEHQGENPEVLQPLLAAPIKGYRALDPTSPRRGPCNKQWMVQVNLPGK